MFIFIARRRIASKYFAFSMPNRKYRKVMEQGYGTHMKKTQIEKQQTQKEKERQIILCRNE